jgi:hypothetical protein
MSFTVSMNNEKIFMFYNKHKQFNVEKINLFIIDLLENMQEGDTTSLQTSLYTEISNLHKEYKKSNEANLNIFDKKFAEFKHGYVEDLKLILLNNNTEKIGPIIKEYLENFQEKTKVFFYENQNTSNLSKQFESLKLSINEELNKQKDLHCNLTKLLENMGNSSIKGRISENTVFNILLDLNPTAEIEYVGTESGKGDILFKRFNKPIIMIENKDYARNVNTCEVDKFKRDAENLDCSAILLSQRHGIVEKENYQIEIVNNNIYIYVHNVEYSADKIKIAIDIIDHFKKEMIITDRNINMDTSTLNSINEDYNKFIKNKLVLINTIQLFTKNINTNINELELPNIEKYLADCGCKRETFKEWNCKFCNRIFPTEKGLRNHNRTCKSVKIAATF